MKPIKLVIKGLNSFIEEQTIDFNKLTDRGLFGIFGPTGSGKSTILDGITLALYGDIARKSSNFINTNCNDLNVSFTFQISGTPNRIYTVSRHFKRDKKTGNAKTHSAVVKEITDGNEEILAESVKGVTETCKSIIGLSLEDFTRTVVLPQGKFSEFLKLEGKQRREMLERLFNLQEYGDQLAIKLSREIKMQNDEANKLLGELNSYEGISDEKLEEEKQHLAQVTETLNQVKAKQDKVEVRYKKGEEVWQMQKELATYRERQAQLEMQTETIENQKQKVKQGESAAKVYPFLQGYQKTQVELSKTQEAHSLLQAKEKALTLEKQEVEKVYTSTQKEKEESLPELQSKGIQLEEAINETKRLEELENFIRRVEGGLKTVVQDITQASDKERKLSLQIDEIQTLISKLQDEEKQYKVEETTRAKVQEGLRLTEIYTLNKENLDKLVASYNEGLDVKKVLEVEKSKACGVLEEKKKALDVQLKLQNEHLQGEPITREQILQKQEQLVATKEKYSQLEKLRAEMKISKDKLESYEAQKQQIVIEYEKSKVALEKGQAEFEAAKMENLAHLLRAQLQNGGACPVCGSTEHHLESVAHENHTKVDELAKELKGIEENYKAIEKALTDLQMNQGAEETQLKRLQLESLPLEELFKEESMDKQEKAFIVLTEALKQFEEKKSTFEKEVTTLKEEYLKLEAEVGQKQIKLDENQKQIDRLTVEIAEGKKVLVQTEEKLKLLKKEVATSDFVIMSQEILAKDRKREETSVAITKKNEEKEQLLKEREEVKARLNERQIRLGSGITKYDESQKQKQEVLSSIGKRLQQVLKLKAEQHIDVKQGLEETTTFLKQEMALNEMLKGKKVYISVNQISEGDASRQAAQLTLEQAAKYEEVSRPDDASQKVTQDVLNQWFTAYPVLGECIIQLETKLGALLEVINQTATNIEQRFIMIKEKKEEIDRQYEVNSKLLVEETTKLEAFTKRLNTDKENLDQQLREEDLTEEEVKIYLLTKEEIEALKQQINQYQEEKSKLIGSIEAVEGRLGSQRIEEEQWLQLQEERTVVTKQVEEITKTHINLTTLVKQIEDALAKLGQLREKKQKIEHKLAILGDLEKLFKGKKFVEFVAITRLKYVSLEASKKLREITNGIYGLEVDEDGKFIIRDYKNGGAKRDASTLSGGETFLASLALALALSAEIQLKGTAPLELFFLDEGFGTLDDDLLEVVMGALERLHNDKLKVGIISHVEAIKNRVPVKLLLTPAEAGKGGTKVKLERS